MRTLSLRQFTQRTLLLTTLLLISAPSWANEKVPFSAESIRKHIQYLASTDLKGRGSGESGNNRAAQYIAKEFAKQGLKPLGTESQGDPKASLDGSGYFQPFHFNAGRALGRENYLRFEREGKSIKLRINRDFQPSTVSGPGKAEAEVLFAGYGISAPAANHDDFKGVDVKGKVILLLAGTPKNDPHSPLAEFGDIRRKALNLREMGASALIVVLPKESDAQDISHFENATSAHTGIPIIRITQEVASNLLGETALKEAVDKADRNEIASHPLPLKASLKVDVKRVEKVTANIIGMIEGTDPVLKNEYVIVGAHMDHLGLGGFGSLSQSRKPAIHYGADDNASGTAGVLSLATLFGGSGAGHPQLRRSLVLICFSGEEMGLLGSAYYVAHPILPLEKTYAMLNMDMIGRMKNQELIVGGTGSAKEWSSILDPANQGRGININKSDSSFGASDHFSFYTKKIPVLFFFSGLHPDYHTPTDTWDKINFEGEEKIVQLVAECTTRVANYMGTFTYQALKASGQESANRGFRVYVGSIPNYAANVEGVLLDGVRPDSPAAKGGLKQGDILIKFGEKSIKSVEDYTLALQDHKPGDTVQVVVKRGNETVTLTLTLTARRQ